MTRFFNTNAFRLAALYFALFAASVLTLFAFFYLSTADFIERQIEATVGAEIRGLQEQYEQLGLDGLVALVRERSLNERVDNMIYVMTDPFVHEIAGNLSGWPRRTTSVKPGWITFPFKVHARNGTEIHTALGTQLILGGDRLLVARDLHDATAFRQRVLSTIAWAALISLGLGVIGGLLMTRQMLRRVESVANTTRHIIHGDLAQRIPLTGSGDEFDQLGGNLNAMLDQIERLMVGMRQVTDNIAHDLRTPLSRLRSRLEVSLLEKPNTARYAEVLRETIAEADQLLGTFNALLSIAEAEAGSRRDTATTVDLATIARNVAELYEPVADDKGLTLALAVPETLPVRGDRHLLSQAIANLLDNALKYTPTGTVSLSVEREGDAARIEVTDTGPGIPPDRREVVFDRFVRLEGSRSTPGNGLGLSLVRAVAMLHGGTVRLEDNNPGLKAIFTLPATSAVQVEPVRASDARPAA
ncbi:MAG: HAMP domain-containing histidine kinase [Alphaproteobacteria bacterium]|nr:HAMP domain-containing histidine kinase [Alphaproteobacteria bacterium]